jgi:Spy/CpxP family protein refolding chaperone
MLNPEVQGRDIAFEIKKQEVSMTKRLIMLAAAVLMVLTPLVAQPGSYHRDRMKHSQFGTRMVEKNLIPAKMLLKFKDEIGLTDAQVSKLEGMQQSMSEASIRGRADIKILQMKLDTYLKGDKIDRKKLETMIREIAKMKTDMHIDKMNYMLDVKGVLTADQLKKIDEFKKNRRKHMMNRRHSKQGKRGERGMRGSGSYGSGQGSGYGNGGNIL